MTEFSGVETGRFSDRVLSMSPSATLAITAKSMELKRQGVDVISLSAGQPDFPPPEPVIQAAVEALKEGKTRYTATAGIPELREEIASRYGERRGVDFEPGQVLVSCGAKHSLSNLLEAAVKPGDVVAIPKPYWVSYPEMIRRVGGVPFPIGRDGMLADAEDVFDAVQAGARGILLNSPCNPTGLMYDRGQYEELADVVSNTGLWVITDDIYEDLVYEGRESLNLLNVRPELSSRVVIVSGVSKTYAMTGWRIGYSIGPEQWIKLAATVQSHTTSNACSVSQYASLAAVSGKAETEKLSMLERFAERRKLICDLLEGVDGVGFEVPDGAFYVFVDVGTHPLGNDSVEFCRRLLEDEALAVIPGVAFGTEGYVRVSFAASDEDITEGVERLRRFVSRGGER
jgi:aspartate aminotransferase